MPPSPKLPLGLQSDIVQTPHVMLNRENGISPVPFCSLNLSYGVGDKSDNVAQNRNIIKKMLGLKFLASAKQIHGDKVYIVGSIGEDLEFSGYDALITQKQGIGLLIQQADCQAILLHDPGREVVGAIHCGWRGSVLNIIAKTIARMQEEFRTDPISLQAVISPSLGPCCGEFIHYKDEFPQYFQQFQPSPAHFDFQAISREQLVDAGVLSSNIDVMKTCTMCNTSFFSYRRSRRKRQETTGRQGSIICLAA